MSALLVLHKNNGLENNSEKMKIAVFHLWELYDCEKNDVLRLIRIHGYYKNDLDMAI